MVRIAAETPWYDLFSRGARDWLRHNDKVREAVKQHLPEIVAGADVLSGGARTVRVPVRMLEHYHFRLRPPSQREGVGQGNVKPGDVLARPQQPGEGPGKGQGGKDDGGVELKLEFKIDDIAAALAEAEAAGRVLLVAVHLVNNETGVVQPIERIEVLVGASPHYLFVDAVQAFGKHKLEFASRAADMMAVSSHKIGGPAGVAALLMKNHAGEVRREHVELEVALGHHLVRDLLAALVAGLARLLGQLVEPAALHVQHLAQGLGDLLVDAPEVVLLEAVAALAPQALHEVAHAHELLAVAVPEALLHEAAQGRVQVPVVQEVVGDLLEDRLGVEVEADLGAVPAGVPEVGARHRRHRTGMAGDPVD